MGVPQVTEKDRKMAIAVCPYRKEHLLPDGLCVDCERFASELAAATRRGEIAEHKRICKQCKWSVFEEPVKCRRLKQLEGGE